MHYAHTLKYDDGEIHSVSLHRRSPSSFLPYNRPCFTRFHLESDRSVNRKTTMRKSAANFKLQRWIFSKYSSVISDVFDYRNSYFKSIYYSISNFNYRLISPFLNTRLIVLKCMYDYSTTNSIAIRMIMVDNNAINVHNNDTSCVRRMMRPYGMTRACQR